MLNCFLYAFPDPDIQASVCQALGTIATGLALEGSANCLSF